LIQRIQSIFLATVGVVSGFTAWLFDFVPNNFWDVILFLLIAVSGFTALFCYKNRRLQKKINYFNIIINVVLIGFMVYALLTPSGGGFTPEKGVEFIVPAVLIVLLAMANIYISKDDRLVKSVDRFR
jgi:peptidoglycan/LPS O-acetylase OafA/YrhL